MSTDRGLLSNDALPMVALLLGLLAVRSRFPHETQVGIDVVASDIAANCGIPSEGGLLNNIVRYVLRKYGVMV